MNPLIPKASTLSLAGSGICGCVLRDMGGQHDAPSLLVGTLTGGGRRGLQSARAVVAGPAAAPEAEPDGV